MLAPVSITMFAAEWLIDVIDCRTPDDKWFLAGDDREQDSVLFCTRRIPGMERTFQYHLARFRFTDLQAKIHWFGKANSSTNWGAGCQPASNAGKMPALQGL